MNFKGGGSILSEILCLDVEYFSLASGDANW